MEWFNKTVSGFMDPELLVMILLIIVSAIALKLIYKLISGHKIVKILFTVACIGGIVFMLVSYIQKNEEVFSTKPTYYVYGKVGTVSATLKKMDVDSVKTNFAVGGEGRVTVKVPNSVNIVDETNKNNKLKLSEIKSGYTVQVLCKTIKKDPNTGEITASKIVVKRK